MHQSDLSGVGGGHEPGDGLSQRAGERQGAIDYISNGEEQEQSGEDTGADDVEHQVDDGGPLGAAAGADGGQHGGDTGTDVLTEQHEHRAGQADHAAVGQGLKDTHRGGRGLDDGSEAGTGQNAQQGVGEGGHEADEGLRLPQGRHGGAHHIHTDEQHAQAGQNLTDVLQLGLFHKDHQGHAHKGEQGSQLAYVQGDEQAGDRSTDVGAHDDPDRLIEGHHARVDKANHHDRGGGRRLNDGGDGRTHQHAQKAVGSQSFQNHFHTASGCGLQAGAHHLHAVQE